ncbi:MAG: hypothetical protein AMXMBFR33_31590 [Candidatus Xenobia bacterium]
MSGLEQEAAHTICHAPNFPEGPVSFMQDLFNRFEVARVHLSTGSQGAEFWTAPACGQHSMTCSGQFSHDF